MEQQAKKQKVLPKSEVAALDGKNKGVENRIQRDLAEMRKSADGKDPYQMLRKKAELYERMMRGELEVGGDQALIDFDTKREEQQNRTPALRNNNYSEASSSSDANEQFMAQILQNKELVSNDMQREAARIEWERHALDEMIEERSRMDHSKAIHEEAQKTVEARKRVQEVRVARKKKLKKRIAKIKMIKELQQQQNQQQQANQQYEDQGDESDDE